MTSQTMNRRTLSASTLTGDTVRNTEGQELGTITETMIDVPSGRIAYAVLDMGGFLGIGNKLFALPWQALDLDAENHEFVLDVPKEKLESAPGFPKDEWPDFSNPEWSTRIHDFYGIAPLQV